MAEEAPPQAAVTEPPPETPPPEPKDERTVPYDRFAEVNTRAKEAENKNKNLEQRLQELADKDKSELEQERAKRERLEQDLTERESRLVSLERGGWVRDAALGAKFIDPADAVALTSLGEIESEDDAKRAVKDIAKNKKHLIQSDPPPKPQLGRVLVDGQPVDPNAPDPEQEEAEQFVAELKAASKKGWSSAGASDT